MRNIIAVVVGVVIAVGVIFAAMDVRGYRAIFEIASHFNQSEPTRTR